MAEDWLVLSDRAALTEDAGDLVHSGLFVVELALPLSEPAVLLNFQTADGWPRTFTLFHDPMAGFVLIHRQGQSVARHALAGPLAPYVGTARLSLRFDAPGRVWEFRLDHLDAEGRPSVMAKGHNPLPLRPQDLVALSHGRGGGRRHAAVLWFGLTRGADLPARAPWIGQRTPVETARGPVLAGNLRPGDLVATADGGLLPLRQIVRLDLPACGSFAPVILRAPFYGSSHDLLVSADQRIVLSGPEVEYSFGEDEVLVDAAALVDGRTALADQRRAVASVLRLEFDHPAMLVADGCALWMASRGQHTPLRMLQPYEVLTLMTLWGRSGPRRVA